jgi:predicted PurR-regulated permease PerM
MPTEFQAVDEEAALGADAAPRAEILDSAAHPVEPVRIAPVQIILAALGTIAFLYFARPVVLPVFLAFVAGTTLKPLIGWFSYCRITPALSTALVLCFLVTMAGIGLFQLGQPASRWINEAPQHITELRQRIQTFFPRVARFNQAAAAMENLGAPPAEQAKAPTVELKTSRVPNAFINWTGSLVAGAGEALVLLYLLLASGDLFLQKLVHVMPTLRDKKRAVEISREIQQNISNYLFSVTLINIGLGAIVSAGLYFLGVPNAAMWGMLVAVLNFVPYFGPVAGVIMLAVAGPFSLPSSRVTLVVLSVGCWLARAVSAMAKSFSNSPFQWSRSASVMRLSRIALSRIIATSLVCATLARAIAFAASICVALNAVSCDDIEF